MRIYGLAGPGAEAYRGQRFTREEAELALKEIVSKENPMTTPKEKFDHPCKQTCSGWQQGYERGVEENPTADKIFRLQRELVSEFALADRLAGALAWCWFHLRTKSEEALNLEGYKKAQDALIDYKKTRGFWWE